jgi:ketosteroid isomerase-like protein
VNDSPNVELIRTAFERWNAGDRGAPLELIDPDVEIRTAISEAFKGEPFRGHEGAREWLAALDENFETWNLVADEFLERGETIVVLGHIRARGRGSGVELDQDVGWVFQIRDGKMLRLHTFLDREEALAAAGMSPRDSQRS